MTPRPRSRASARKAGTAFETAVARYLNEHVDDRIERRAKSGAKDRGDLSGVRTPHGARVVGECKDRKRLDLPGAYREADLERGNDDAAVALVIHKRQNVGDIGQQWVTCTLADLVALLTGSRPLSAEDLAFIAEDTRFERTQDAASTEDQ